MITKIEELKGIDQGFKLTYSNGFIDIIHSIIDAREYSKKYKVKITYA